MTYVVRMGEGAANFFGESFMYQRVSRKVEEGTGKQGGDCVTT